VIETQHISIISQKANRIRKLFNGEHIDTVFFFVSQGHEIIYK